MVPNVHVRQTTPAAMFMQERPDGPVQTDNEQLKALARRVTAQVQKKSTTAAEGRAGLQGVAAEAHKDNNKENVPQRGPPKKSKVARNSQTKGTKAKKNNGQKSLHQRKYR
jgi:hypothetical protein